MIKSTKIFKLPIILFLLFFTFAATAQVGIGTNSPAEGALLDLTSADKGFLVPRVDILDLTTELPITTTGPAAAVGLLVWNTGVTGVGFHYWDGNDWIPLGGGATGNNWDLAGNTITGTEVLGTLSNHDLNIITNGLVNPRVRVQANGETTVGFGAAASNPGDQFSAVGTATNGNGVSGYSGGSGNGVYGQNVANGNGVYGLVGNPAPLNPLTYATGTAVRGTNQGGELIDFSSPAAFVATYQSGGVGVRAENFWLNNYSLHAVDGYYSVFGENNFGLDAVVGDTDDAVSNAVWGRNPNVSGTAVLGGSNGLSIYRTGGSGVAGSGNTVGVFGYAGLGANAVANRGNAAGVFDLDTDANPTTTTGNNGTRALAQLAGFDNVTPNGVLAARNSYFGGYFVGGNVNGTPSYAYAGMKYSTNNFGTTGTDYKIIGNGTNSTIIRDRNNTPRILFSPEAPEILFEDYGIGKLVNGVAQINIDPILKDAIYVDANHPLKVFIQLEGDCNGVYVTNKSASGFTVKELQSGQSNVAFSWHLVANRADTKDASGTVTSKHVGLRLPIGPDLLEPNKAALKKVQDINKPNNPKQKGKEKIDVSKKTEELSSSNKQRPNRE